MATAIRLEHSGFIDPNYSTAGYYILTVITSIISGISYDVIPTLPIQSISLILILIMILRNITEQKSSSSLLIMALMMVYITKFNNISLFGYSLHNLGFILFLLVISVAILRLRSEYKNEQMISLILIIAIISLNYISYKYILFTLCFLGSLQLIELFFYQRFRTRNIKKSNFMIVTIIGIVYVFMFNRVVYSHFIPRVRMASELKSSGIYKLLLKARIYDPLDPLNKYYFRTQNDILYATTIWYSLICIVLILLSINLFQKFIKKENFSIGEKVISAILASSLVIFIIYTYLGTSLIYILIIPGIIGYLILYNSHFINYKKFVTFFIFLLLALNVYITIQLYTEDFYGEMRDWNYYNYINPSFKWYAKYMFNESSNSHIFIETDVFTGGYFVKELAKENIPRFSMHSLLSRNDMLFILKHNISASKIGDYAFVINYRLHSILVDNWELFTSWTDNRKLIITNPYIDGIYSSGDIVIYITNKVLK